MSQLTKKPLARIGYDFISAAYLPAGADEYYLREQQATPRAPYRELSAYEIEVLVRNNNQSDNWNAITVQGDFDPRFVKNCQFYGRIRIGALQPYFLEYHELKLPVGLYNSTIVSCDIGDNVVIKNVDYLAHYLIGNEVILFNINEMQTTNHAKFGNGIVKTGEPEEVRIWLEIGNENGGRKVIPFDGMACADAWLWAKFRDRPELMDRFRDMTERQFDARRGYYGTVGDRTVIKNTRILKDVKVGSHAYIKGGNKLKNLTINSSADSPSQIGEGVELVNGIMGYGSRAFYGVKAVRFVMGENTTLKYGARLINSFLGDNSTISCCEVLNSLILPAHEQHHNNSFLVAATVLGQSNIAAGATIGSNHNSRGADGEIIAGRGFWPGLCVNLKHNSRFASFCLVAKGSYSAELDIPFPFALVSQDEAQDCLLVMPAYWWRYNMYALARNAWKYEHRDQRRHAGQPIAFDFLAPDTVAELFRGLHLLEQFTAQAFLQTHAAANGEPVSLTELGRKLLGGDPSALSGLLIRGENMENAGREVRLLKAPQAYQAYREMIHYYAVKTLVAYGEKEGLKTWEALNAAFAGSVRERWINLGGQLAPQSELDAVLEHLRSGAVDSWDALHDQYRQIATRYPRQNAANAFASLLELHQCNAEDVTPSLWTKWLEEAVAVARLMARRTRESREKDYANPFRKMVYDTEEEMEAVLGPLDGNGFIRKVMEAVAAFEEIVREWNLRLVR